MACIISSLLIQLSFFYFVYCLFIIQAFHVCSSVWKIYLITFIFKLYYSFDVGNFWLISIILHLAKLFVSLLYSRMNISLNHIITEKRHSCRPGKSIFTSGVAFIAYLSDAIEQVKSMLSKRRLIQLIAVFFFSEFESSGLGNPLLSKLSSYLYNSI